MKKILIIQNELPEYRNFLWSGLRKKFQLYLINASTSTVTLPSGKCQFNFDEIKNIYFDVLIVNASIKNIFSIIKYKFIYKYKEIYGWTQYLGVNKSIIFCVIKYFFYISFFKRILLYYEFEKKYIPFNFAKEKFYYLNNTIENQVISNNCNRQSSEFLFIGRNTTKANLAILFKAISLAPSNCVFHFVGVDRSEISDFKSFNRCFFYGNTSDKCEIAKIASSCKYFIYPGNVGLSVIHAIKLGLIPILHSELTAHMPEFLAIYGKLPVIHFEKGSYISLAATIKKCAESEIDYEKEIIKYAKNYFDESIAIDNFSRLILENNNG